MSGRYVALEPITTAHAPDLYATLCAPEDRELWTYRSTEPPGDVAGMEAMTDGWATSADDVTWALVPTDERAAGMITFTRIEPGHGQVEVAAVIYARSIQRTTAATEAIHLSMRYAFDDLGYRRFEWRCWISGQTRSTSRPGEPRLGSASPTRGGSATTWSPRAATATPTGSRSPTPSGPP